MLINTLAWLASDTVAANRSYSITLCYKLVLDSSFRQRRCGTGVSYLGFSFPARPLKVG